MRWQDLNLNPNTRVLRQFGTLLALVCGATALWQIIDRNHTTAAIAWGACAVLLVILTAWKPNSLRHLFVISSLVTFPIGWCVSQAILLILFFGVITPLGLLFRLMGRDPLNMRPSGSLQQTFWAQKRIGLDKRHYFRQF